LVFFLVHVFFPLPGDALGSVMGIKANSAMLVNLAFTVVKAVAAISSPAAAAAKAKAS